MNGKVLAINGCHDASVTFLDKNDQIRIFEYERFCNKRFGIFKQEADGTSIGTNEEIRNSFLNYIKTHLKEEPEVILYSELDPADVQFVRSHFPKSQMFHMGHHMSHCSGAYFQSGFENALAISLDGGGMDYQTESDLTLRSYSIYKFTNGISETIIHTNSQVPDRFVFNPGIYGSFGYYVEEINKEVNEIGQSDKCALTYAGKMMGLAAYGEVRPEWIEPISNFYKNHPIDHWSHYDPLQDKMSSEMGVELFENCFSGKESYDLAATNQYVFEELCFSFIEPYIDQYNLDVVFSGGCALNVLFNQKLAKYLNDKGLKLYIPPYPGDCGLSFGHSVSYQTEFCDPSPYCGIDIMDRDKIIDYFELYNKEGKVSISTTEKIVDLIKDGKIGGIIQGYSEVGPRALGNRSIICDPSIADMKDVLNAKVKFREWFRPFAPVCREEDMDLYFDDAFPSEYMSYAPSVKEEHRSVLPSITHVDGTARLQTVRKGQHKLFYDILTELNARGHVAVIMNTSFNIKGKPILTSVKDAFDVLETTELDFIVVENLLFVK
jgi:carbamoyltransferase